MSSPTVAQNVAAMNLAYAELSARRAFADAALGIPSPQRRNDCITVFSSGRVLAAFYQFGVNLDPVATFTHHVNHVEMSVPTKQMVRTHAVTKVAVMADVNLRGVPTSRSASRSIGQDEIVGDAVRNPVCEPGALVNADHAIAGNIGPGCPDPTGADLRAMLWDWSVLVDLGPEPADLNGRILLMHQAHSWCQAPGVTARRGHLMSTFYHKRLAQKAAEKQGPDMSYQTVEPQEVA